MGQRVLQPIVNQQVKNVLAALDQQVAKAGGRSTLNRIASMSLPVPHRGDAADMEPLERCSRRRA